MTCFLLPLGVVRLLHATIGMTRMAFGFPKVLIHFPRPRRAKTKSGTARKVIELKAKMDENNEG